MPDHETEEILWYQPDPRAVIPLDGFHASKSLLKSIHKNGWTFTVNNFFEQVMSCCADRQETWINHEIKDSYKPVSYTHLTLPTNREV